MAKPEKKLQELKTRLLEVGDLNHINALLGWDQSTYMPPGAAEARGRQSARLAQMAQEKFIDKKIGKLLDALRPYEERHALTGIHGRVQQGDGRLGLARGADQRERPHEEAEDHAARGAKEDPGGIEVEKEESERRPAEARHEQHAEDVLEEQRHQEQRDGHEEAHARGQAVKTVNQVQGIGNSDNPEDGKGDGEQTEFQHPGSKREGKNLYLKSDRDQ